MGIVELYVTSVAIAVVFWSYCVVADGEKVYDNVLVISLLSVFWPLPVFGAIALFTLHAWALMLEPFRYV